MDNESDTLSMVSGSFCCTRSPKVLAASMLGFGNTIAMFASNPAHGVIQNLKEKLSPVIPFARCFCQSCFFFEILRFPPVSIFAISPSFLALVLLELMRTCITCTRTLAAAFKCSLELPTLELLWDGEHHFGDARRFQRHLEPLSHASNVQSKDTSAPCSENQRFGTLLLAKG
mmetsp:Transcript_105683/g.187939  ORF Transcript_105683/g.187939 Transcript_105683/m.187939 type:complete len:173 (+) Transcript_105683:119-637(+)